MAGTFGDRRRPEVKLFFFRSEYVQLHLDLFQYCQVYDAQNPRNKQITMVYTSSLPVLLDCADAGIMTKAVSARLLW